MDGPLLASSLSNGVSNPIFPIFPIPDFDQIRFHIGKIGNFFLPREVDKFPLDVIVTLISYRTL